MDINNLMINLGEYCKFFRIVKIKLSLTEFSNLVNANMKNISSFESGRANNIIYLYYYYQLAPDEEKQGFINGIFQIDDKVGE